MGHWSNWAVEVDYSPPCFPCPPSFSSSSLGLIMENLRHIQKQTKWCNGLLCVLKPPSSNSYHDQPPIFHWYSIISTQVSMVVFFVVVCC